MGFIKWSQTNLVSDRMPLLIFRRVRVGCCTLQIGIIEAYKTAVSFAKQIEMPASDDPKIPKLGRIAFFNRLVPRKFGNLQSGRFTQSSSYRTPFSWTSGDYP